jgi:hypothetical protein
MSRTITLERATLKDEAITLHRLYGWSERRIAAQLHIPLSNNIQHLEGDCLGVGGEHGQG